MDHSPPPADEAKESKREMEEESEGGREQEGEKERERKRGKGREIEGERERQGENEREVYPTCCQKHEEFITNVAQLRRGCFPAAKTWKKEKSFIIYTGILDHSGNFGRVYLQGVFPWRPWHTWLSFLGPGVHL